MRLNTLFSVSVAATSVVAATGLTDEETLEALRAAPIDLSNKPNFWNHLTNRNAVNLEAAPASQVPQVQIEKSTYPGATRKKIRYGPYRIPSTKENNVESALMKVSGMSDHSEMNGKKPCSDCMLLEIASNLEYANGKIANTDTGSWLHHVLLINTGPTVRDYMCGGKKMEVIMEDGNERMPNRFYEPAAPFKSGYHLSADDKLVVTTELMNLDPKEKYVWLTISYEYLDGPPKANFKQGHQLFLSIGPSCSGFVNPYGASNLTAGGQPKTRVFSEKSIPWKSPVNGYILGTGGHLHDGGTSLEVLRNKNVICNSLAVYQRSAGGMGGMSSGAGMHIAQMKQCANLGALHKGDTITLRANYNFDKHQGMKNKDGQLDEVMGMAGFSFAI
jgi:hypothetical protein